MPLTHQSFSNMLKGKRVSDALIAKLTKADTFQNCSKTAPGFLVHAFSVHTVACENIPCPAARQPPRCCENIGSHGASGGALL
jgi:hypothetical protein